jgi:hypothetical protein
MLMVSVVEHDQQRLGKNQVWAVMLEDFKHNTYLLSDFPKVKADVCNVPVSENWSNREKKISCY